MGVSVPTLLRMESGDPGVGIGIYATALWLVGRDGALVDLASPEVDKGAVERDVRAAIELGKAWAHAPAEARIKRKLKRDQESDDKSAD